MPPGGLNRENTVYIQYVVPYIFYCEMPGQVTDETYDKIRVTRINYFILLSIELFATISHVTIIAESAICFNAIFSASFGVMRHFYIINMFRIICGCLEI